MRNTLFRPVSYTVDAWCPSLRPTTYPARKSRYTHFKVLSGALFMPDIQVIVLAKTGSLNALFRVSPQRVCRGDIMHFVS